MKVKNYEEENNAFKQTVESLTKDKINLEKKCSLVNSLQKIKLNNLL